MPQTDCKSEVCNKWTVASYDISDRAVAFNKGEFWKSCVISKNLHIRPWAKLSVNPPIL